MGNILSRAIGSIEAKPASASDVCHLDRLPRETLLEICSHLPLHACAALRIATRMASDLDEDVWNPARLREPFKVHVQAVLRCEKVLTLLGLRHDSCDGGVPRRATLSFVHGERDGSQLRVEHEDEAEATRRPLIRGVAVRGGAEEMQALGGLGPPGAEAPVGLVLDAAVTLGVGHRVTRSVAAAATLVLYFTGAEPCLPCYSQYALRAETSASRAELGRFARTWHALGTGACRVERSVRVKHAWGPGHVSLS